MAVIDKEINSQLCVIFAVMESVQLILIGIALTEKN